MSILFGVFQVFEAQASFPTKGVFTATQSCEAYVSKNKRTNPDNTRLKTGQRYILFEINQINDPSWYRLSIPGITPPDRWVAANCGESSSFKIVQHEKHDRRGKTCNTPGLVDGYVLALIWHATFCDSRDSKPECRESGGNGYQEKNFTLHGLWPNNRKCAASYGFCGEVRNRRRNFCNYPVLTLSEAVRDSLEEVMPSAAAGSCLQRHEWFKHGTCQSQWSIDEYFDLAVNLTRQFNESGIGYFMSRHDGKFVTERAFIKQVGMIYGDRMHQNMKLKCHNGSLEGVYVYLSGNIDKSENLRDLAGGTNRRFKSDCGGKFKVGPTGFTNYRH